VIDLIENFTKIFDFSDVSVFGNQAPFDFDVSVKDIYSTLKNCASMHLIPKELFSFPGELIKYLNEKKINTAIWATSALRIVANLKALEKEKPLSLKKVMFSGEVMPNKVLNYWRKSLPDILYVNLYGPTEITCNCTYYIADREFSDQEPLPIGIPFPNSDILVLNEKNRLVEKGETGEICVRGTSLALGYYNNAEEQARAFCQNPLNTNYPELIYRTGDLGKYNDRGELMFLSRKDNQVKHMGHRIELEEIEVAVNSLDFLDAGCCIYSPEEEKIVLFYQASRNYDREILLGLREYLPKYMRPNKLIHFEKLPMNKNAKIDRVKLKKLYFNE
jgi:D-alanine--poly(phosphoribitol) ligase subunit 1